MPLGMEVGLGPGDFVLEWNPAPQSQKGAEPLPNFRPMSIAAKRLDGSRRHLAQRWALFQATLCKIGTQLPPQKRERSPLPNFRTISIVAKWLDASRCHLVWRYASAQATVLDGDPAPSPKRGRSSQFAGHVYCGQTAAWIKMPRGTQVGLSPNDIVTLCYMGTQLPPQKKGTAPRFSAHVYCDQTAVCTA